MIKIIFNTLLGIFLIWVWLQSVEIEQILKQLSEVNLVYLLPVFFFLGLAAFFRTLRFKIFLSEIKKIKLIDLFFLNGVAMMLNFFIPIRAGEIAKGVYLNTKYQLPLGKSIIWVFVDRFLDFLFVLLAAGLLLVIVPTSLNITFIKIITVIFTVGLIATYLAVFQLSFSRKLTKFLSQLLVFNIIKIYFNRVSNFILDAFSILDRHPKDLALMFLVTALGYATEALTWYFTFLALGIPQQYVKMYLGLLLSALTYLVPAAPGYVGSAEASGLIILSGVFGIDKNIASSMVVLLHIIIAVFILVFGLLSVFFLKINLGLILRKALRQKN